MKSAIDVYCNQDTSETLELHGHRLHMIQALKQFKIGTWTILPLEGVHDVPVLSFLIMNEQKEKLLFLIDSAYTKYKFKNLKYIMIGINYQTEILRENVEQGLLHPGLANRIMSSHMSLDTALSFCEAQDLSKVRAICPIHVSESNADKDQIKKAIQRQTGKLII